MNNASPAADAAIELLTRTHPQHAETVTPFIYRLFAALNDGHAYINLTGAEAQLLQTVHDIVGNGDASTPLVLSENLLFLGKMWQLEEKLATEMVRLAQASVVQPDIETAQNRLHTWFSHSGSLGQQHAAALALLQPFMVITGGPGTGKTTTVAKLLGLLCHHNNLPRIALAAPTGKAAAHMANALHNALQPLGLPENVHHHLMNLGGTTIHRLLGIAPPALKPRHHADYPLPLDILIVDEASMLDTALFLTLLQAVPTGCRVILLGDENQLPSVGAGAALSALSQPTVLDAHIAQQLSQILPHHHYPISDSPPPLAANVAHLTVSHRFGDDSGLGCLARAVVSGDADTAWVQFTQFPNEIKAATYSHAELAAQLATAQNAYWQAIQDSNIERAFALLSETVVLTATREDAQQFNEIYSRHLKQHAIVPSGTEYFPGQIIMIRQNDYTLGLFNGDIGIIFPDNHTPAAWFTDGNALRRLPIGLLPPFDTAFALTVHKSQGSEYQSVWLLTPQTTTENTALNRALLYTAITRARKHFTFCGSQSCFQAACIENGNRRSGLPAQIAKQLAAKNQ